MCEWQQKQVEEEGEDDRYGRMLDMFKLWCRDTANLQMRLNEYAYAIR